MKADVNTDGRILSILRSGEAARRAVDPDALSGRLRVAELEMDFRQGGLSWKLWLVTPSGDKLSVGVVHDDDGDFVSRAAFISGDEVANLPVKRSKTLVEALGNLSELPERLKPALTFTGPENAFDGDAEDFSPQEVYVLAKNALFHGVEGADEKALCDRFGSVRIRYDHTPEGMCFGAHLVGFFNEVSFRIVVSVDMEVYGMKGKGVRLSYAFGMGHYMDADCFYVKEGRKKPSILLAFDLASKLGGLYAKEKHKKKKKKYPVTEAKK